MSEHYCPECADGWSGAYTCELRCTTCGSALKVRDSDPSRLNPEVEIKELNAVIDQLTERAEKAERERDALAAHVERLRAEYATPGYASRLVSIGRILDEAPATSLARLKAQWQSDAAVEWSAIAVLKILEEVEHQIGATIPVSIINDALGKLGLRKHFGDERVDKAKAALKLRRQAEEAGRDT